MDRRRVMGSLAVGAGWVVRRLPGMAGAGLISAAGWMVYQPAGLAIAGVFCLLADWRTR